MGLYKSKKVVEAYQVKGIDTIMFIEHRLPWLRWSKESKVMYIEHNKMPFARENDWIVIMEDSDGRYWDNDISKMDDETFKSKYESILEGGN